MGGLGEEMRYRLGMRGYGAVEERGGGGEGRLLATGLYFSLGPCSYMYNLRLTFCMNFFTLRGLSPHYAQIQSSKYFVNLSVFFQLQQRAFADEIYFDQIQSSQVQSLQSWKYEEQRI